MDAWDKKEAVLKSDAGIKNLFISLSFAVHAVQFMVHFITSVLLQIILCLYLLHIDYLFLSNV
jgi:hypothetical protein